MLLTAQLQILGVDQIAVAQGKGALQYIFQFAHIARKMIALQHALRIGRKLGGRQPDIGGEFVQQVLGEQGDVFASFAQWRYRELNHIQAIK